MYRSYGNAHCTRIVISRMSDETVLCTRTWGCVSSSPSGRAQVGKDLLSRSSEWMRRRVHCTLCLEQYAKDAKVNTLVACFFFLRLLLCLLWSWLFCLPFFYECRTLAGSVHVWKLLEVGRTLTAMDIACQYRNTPAISRPYQKAIQKMDSRFSATRRVSDDWKTISGLANAAFESIWSAIIMPTSVSDITF